MVDVIEKGTAQIQKLKEFLLLEKQEQLKTLLKLMVIENN